MSDTCTRWPYHLDKPAKAVEAPFQDRRATGKNGNGGCNECWERVLGQRRPQPRLREQCQQRPQHWVSERSPRRASGMRLLRLRAISQREKNSSQTQVRILLACLLGNGSGPRLQSRPRETLRLRPTQSTQIRVSTRSCVASTVCRGWFCSLSDRDGAAVERCSAGGTRASSDRICGEIHFPCYHLVHVIIVHVMHVICCFIH